MLKEIRFHIDDSILLSLKEEKEHFAQDMLFHHAVWLYHRHKLSLGKAAELAGLTRIEFIQQLQAAREPIFHYDDEMVSEMIENAALTPAIHKECVP